MTGQGTSEPEEVRFRPSSGFVALSIASPMILVLLGVWGLVGSGEIRALPASILVIGLALAAVALLDVPHTIRLDAVGIHRVCVLRRQLLAWEDLSGLTRSHKSSGPRPRRPAPMPTQPGALDGSDPKDGTSGLAAESWDGRRYLLSYGRERPDTYEEIRSAVNRFAPGLSLPGPPFYARGDRTS